MRSGPRARSSTPSAWRRTPSEPAASCWPQGRRCAVGPRAETRTELTAQEQQIATLAAEGLTNQEIGERLYLSNRTVEWHLRKVFVQLGASSRRDLRGRCRARRSPVGTVTAKSAGGDVARKLVTYHRTMSYSGSGRWWIAFSTFSRFATTSPVSFHATRCPSLTSQCVGPSNRRDSVAPLRYVTSTVITVLEPRTRHGSCHVYGTVRTIGVTARIAAGGGSDLAGWARS